MATRSVGQAPVFLSLWLFVSMDVGLAAGRDRHGVLRAARAGGRNRPHLCPMDENGHRFAARAGPQGPFKIAFIRLTRAAHLIGGVGRHHLIKQVRELDARRLRC